MPRRLHHRSRHRERAFACGGRAPYARCCALILTLPAPSPLLSQAPLGVSGQRVEYLANPVGIDAVRPRLSWRLVSTGRNTMQAAYQVQVAIGEANLARGEDLLCRCSWTTPVHPRCRGHGTIGGCECGTRVPAPPPGALPRIGKPDSCGPTTGPPGGSAPRRAGRIAWPPRRPSSGGRFGCAVPCARRVST